MYPNKESGLGSKMANALFDNVMNANATTGRVFFVCASALAISSELKAIYGNNYPDGTPVVFTTLTLALAATVASRGDVIIIVPGHTETIVGAAGVAVATAGVSIIGVGNGALRPTYTFTTSAAASFDVTAASILIRNVKFVCGIDNQTAVNNVTGADVTFDQCEWTISSGTLGAALCILTAATATRLKVTNSRFVGPATNSGTTCAACIQHESGVDYQIVNNYFTGKMTQAILNVATVLRGLIDNNKFVIGTGTAGITMASASTPFIVNNRFNVASGTTPIVAAAGFVAGNIYSAAAGVTSTGGTSSAAAVSTL